MKTNRRVGGVASPILTIVLDGAKWLASSLSRLTRGEEKPCAIRQETGLAPDVVWTVWSREKCLNSTDNTTSAAEPVALSLYRLSYEIKLK
jgi:hypothetical protein